MALVSRLTAAESEETQTAELVTFCVLPSLKVPVALSCSLDPIASDALFPITAIDCIAAAVTVSPKLLEAMLLWVAVMLAVPIATPVARPPALMLAMDGLELAQVTAFVRFWLVPSLNVPVAVNWTLVPLAIEELLALIAMDCNTAAVTDKATLFDVTPSCVAVILLVPIATPLTRPVALTLATAEFELFQVAAPARLWVLPSLKVPVAVN